MSEPGFEVAAAFVRVAPDASDFPAALDEELGGLSLSVVVTPNAADFADLMDEALAGLSVSVVVTPDASDFAAAFDEQAGDLSVTARVTPDAADFASAFEEQAGSLTARVSVTPEAVGAADFGDSLSEQAGTITVPVIPVPEAANFAAALDEQAGGLSVPVQVYPDTSADDFQAQLDDRVGTPVVGVDLQATVANMAEHIADSLTGAIPVPVVPDAALFAAELDEQVGTLSVTAQVVPGISDFAAALDEEAGGLTLTAVVTPDASDFPSALDEQAGGLTVPVGVVPDAAGFEEALAEQTGGLTVTAEVVPDASGLGAALEGQTGEQAISIPVSADTSAAVEGLGQLTTAEEGAAAGASSLEGQYAALQDQFAGMGSELDFVTGRFAALAPGIAASAEETDALSGSLSSLQAQFAAVGEYISAFGSETDQAGAAVTETAGEVGLLSGMLTELQGNLTAADDAVSAWVDSSSAARDAASSVAELQVAEEGAASEAASLSAQYEALQARLTAVSGGVDELNAQYNYLSQRTVATGEDIANAGADLDILQGQYAHVADSLGTLGSSFTAAGADAAASEGEFAAVSGQMAELQGNVETTAGAFDAWSGRVTGASVQASAGVDVLTESTAGLAAAAPVAADAAAGLSGAAGELGGRLSYMAADPFLWMMGAPLVIGGVTAAIDALDKSVTTYVQGLEQQDNATGYNVSGYKELTGQLTVAAAGYEKVASAQDDNVRSGAGMQEQSAQISAAQQQQVTDLDNLTGHLGTLQATYGLTRGQVVQTTETFASSGAALTALGAQYGLTQQQAQQFAGASGSSLSALASKYDLTSQQAQNLSDVSTYLITALKGGGAAAQGAMALIEGYANSNLDAAGAVSGLSNDLSTFSNDTLTASSRVSALDDAYGTLVGSFVSVQTAQLNVTGGFDSLEAASQAAGASMKGTNTQSVGLQQSFYAQAGAIEQAANAMVQQGDSTQQVTGYISDQITKLSKYEGGNKTAATAVQGLKNWEDSLTGSLQTQGSYLSTTLTNDLDNAILKYSGIQTAVNNYANALVDFGKKSPQAKNAQDLLTESIVKGGNAAGESTGQIAQMISQMEKIPLKEAIQITLAAEGQYQVTGETSVTAPGYAAVQGGGHMVGPATGMAGGGLVTRGSGPTADDVLIRASRGEVVVPADMVSAGAVDHLRGVLPGFAGGGQVSGSYSGSAAGLGSFLAGNYNNTNAMLVQVMENAVAAAIASAQDSGGGSAKAPIIVNFNGTSYPTPEQRQAIMTELSALVGVS